MAPSFAFAFNPTSAMGRFLSPDWSSDPDTVAYAEFENPQSLNLYGYVNNNPLSKADKDGHCAEDFCIVEGAVLNGIQQVVDVGTGAQKSFSGTSMAVSTAAGAVSGGVMTQIPQVKVPGVSSGQGNMKAVAQGVRTKIANGTASNMSLKTAVKGAIGGQVANAGKTATQAAADAASKKECGDKCQ